MKRTLHFAMGTSQHSSAWPQVLLSRYAREEDVVVGTEHANRRQPELEGTVGAISNMLALRTDLSGELCMARVWQPYLVVLLMARMGALMHVCKNARLHETGFKIMVVFYRKNARLPLLVPLMRSARTTARQLKRQALHVRRRANIPRAGEPRAQHGAQRGGQRRAALRVRAAGRRRAELVRKRACVHNRRAHAGCCGRRGRARRAARRGSRCKACRGMPALLSGSLYWIT